MVSEIDVLVVGAGAAGLTLATDLQRRGVTCRLIEAAPRGFEGSRAKGVQPRTLEVFDDLGVLPALTTRSSLYPPLGVHLGPLTVKRTMIKLHKSSDDVPHADTLLVPQYSIDASIRERLEAIGGVVEYGAKFLSFEQDSTGVSVVIERDGKSETVRARYLVGADGGSSPVRRNAGISFVGTTDAADRMIIADLTLTGLRRDRWHIWPRMAGRFMALCPLPDGKFQLMLKLKATDPTELDDALIDRMVREFVGRAKSTVLDIHWTSTWRPNIRLTESYRSGSVFLVGDAAHVHPPTGAQGLNTGVQDAYNLGWKLGQALAGAPDALLDTYEAERRPVATRVLGLATELYKAMGEQSLAASVRGDEERQLALSYRGGPLATAEQKATGKSVEVGDRAPDSPVVDDSGERSTLFDIFRGPQFTSITIGEATAGSDAAENWPTSGAPVRSVNLYPAANPAFMRIYGVIAGSQILVRPDGYVAAITRADESSSLETMAGMMVPVS